MAQSDNASTRFHEKLTMRDFFPILTLALGFFYGVSSSARETLSSQYPVPYCPFCPVVCPPAPAEPARPLSVGQHQLEEMQGPNDVMPVLLKDAGNLQLKGWDRKIPEAYGRVKDLYKTEFCECSWGGKFNFTELANQTHLPIHKKDLALWKRDNYFEQNKQTATSKAETTTWFDELNDETCGKCESRFCTAVNNFAQFSDHLLDGDHVIDVKFPSGWGIDSDWFLELYLSGKLDPLGVKGGIANAFVLDSSDSQTAIRVCLGEEYQNDKTGKIFMKLSGGIPWIDETLLCNCREKETTTAFEMMPTSTTTEAWFRTRQPKKIFSTTQKMTAKQTTLPIESTTAEKTTAEENWLETTTSFQQTSSEKTTSSKQQQTTLPATSTSAYLTQESTPEMKTTLFDSTTWTTSSAYFLPTEAATTMFSRTKKDLEWYKKYSKWRHFLN